MNKEMIFYGVFKDLIPKYIEFKRSLGFAYGYHYIKRLRHMSIFFEKNYPSTDIILSKEMVLDYVRKKDNETNSTIAGRCTVIRGFATFLKDIGYSDIYIIPSQYIPKSSQNFLPYIFTKEQIILLCNIIDNYKFGSNYLNNHKIYSTLIRLLYACGLRISEALSLKVCDIDFDNSIIHILKAKNNCSRLVCMSDSLSNYIKKYINSSKLKNDSLLFLSVNGGICSQSAVSRLFRIFFRKANIYTTANKTPRIHDFRHTFAVHSLQQMIDSGMDIYCALPFLSSFLGHASIYTTEYYLRLVESNFSEVLDKNSNMVFPEVNDFE